MSIIDRPTLNGDDSSERMLSTLCVPYLRRVCCVRIVGLRIPYIAVVLKRTNYQVNAVRIAV